jgi:hypothetical protein
LGEEGLEGKRGKTGARRDEPSMNDFEKFRDK